MRTWVAELPAGRGKAFAGNVNKVGEQFIGVWQLSGLARGSSGLPFGAGNGPFWATDWNDSGLAQMVTKPKTGAFRQPDGSVSAFALEQTSFGALTGLLTNPRVMQFALRYEF